MSVRPFHQRKRSANNPEALRRIEGTATGDLADAQQHPAAIIFFAEIDAIAPNRETMLGDVEKRVVAQLLALMDGLRSRGRIVLMAATNLSNSVDPALRRPGRLNREICLNPQFKAGRRKILQIHSRQMPLGQDVNLDRMAKMTLGFLGEDLAALCREAAMVCSRGVHLRAAACSAVQQERELATLFDRMDHFNVRWLR